MTTSDQDIIDYLMKRWFSPDFCWRCGNKLSWREQIDGPDNLRTVYCDNPIHTGQSRTINLRVAPTSEKET